MATLMIDNYDSFTYNIYQYLEQLGAHVVVHRNDKITIEECIALNPRNIVISPGPGHPLTSSGISREVIETFAGKVPILGVCLGEQCMYCTYGGTVSHTGEIVHGKTSSITHDGKGLFRGVPQGVQVTRYHSLSGDPDTLPDCLEITSWTNSRKVMGVRHKKFIMEGVQFHPESIASEAGYRMIANFLRWEGGTWDEITYRDDLINPVFDKLGYGTQNGVDQGSNGNLIKSGDLSTEATSPKDKAKNKDNNSLLSTSATSKPTTSLAVPLLPSTDSIITSSSSPVRNITLTNTTAAVASMSLDPTSKSTSSTEIITPSFCPLTYSMSSLELIVEQRRIDVAKAKSKPGRSPYHLSKTIEQGFLPKTIDVVDYIKKNPYRKPISHAIKSKDTLKRYYDENSENHGHHDHHGHHGHHGHHHEDNTTTTVNNDNEFVDLAIIAEVKRASPSKGNIDINIHAISEALELVSAGVTCISVITEPRWFKGSISDLRDIRMAFNDIPNRPALIQNDFIIDRYQIMEARINGADAITLYASILKREELIDLINYAHYLSLDVLVIVLNEEEIKLAVSLNVKLIGVNNRDLHTFNVDPKTTTVLAKLVPENVILVALSGIKTQEDAMFYYKNGAKAILVGESLIKAKDKASFVQGLINLHPQKKRRI